LKLKNFHKKEVALKANIVIQNPSRSQGQTRIFLLANRSGYGKQAGHRSNLCHGRQGRQITLLRQSP
jgi:hypothetical protein